jgi:Bacterial protein of unknown function (DUF916)
MALRTRRLISLLSTLAAILVVVPSAIGAGPAAPSFALRPVHYRPHVPETKSYFVFDARPGRTIRSTVRVTNVGTLAGTVKLYAVDGTTGKTSGTVYRNAGGPRRDVGAWLRLSVSTLTLRPRQSRIVSFTIGVPAHVRSGDHVGGIVAENEAVQSSASGKGLQIKIKHLTISAVVVRVPGPATARLGLSRVNASGGHGFQYLNLRLANRGRVMMKPIGSLVLRTGARKPFLRRAIRLDTLIPRTAIWYPVPLPKALKPGRWSVTVLLHYGNRVLVKGQGIGGPLTLRRTFRFAVSGAQYTQTFKGTPQLTRPSSGSSSSSMSTVTVLALATAAVAVLALAGVSFHFRRRPIPR